MSRRRYFGPVALALASAVVIASCSSETPTSPETPSQSLTAAPTIGIWFPYSYNHYYSYYPGQTLCYPYVYNGNRGACGPSTTMYISNTGGGTLNWTSTKSATWIKRSPRYGTAPSTVKVWVDGTGLPPGTYYGKLKVWATGATDSPRTVYIRMLRY